MTRITSQVVIVLVVTKQSIPGTTLLLNLDREIPVQTIQFLDMFLGNPPNSTRVPARRVGRFMTTVQLLHARSQTRRQSPEKRRPDQRLIKTVGCVYLVCCVVAVVVVLATAQTADAAQG